jgi:hypothetical protein
MNPPSDNYQSIHDIIHEYTAGRPYIFMIMAYENNEQLPIRQKVYKTIADIAEKEFNILCLRADKILGTGQELLRKLHTLIDKSVLVVAEISEPRPNVFYEVGYAMGTGKDLIFLVECGKQLPYNLQGLEVLEYNNTFDGIDLFENKVRQHLSIFMRRRLPILREMLGPVDPNGTYIVASPKYPGAQTRIKAQVYDRRTFGDHLGILGIITAFGQLYGEIAGVDLISAQHSAPNLLESDCNFFLIGSPKVNPYSGQILEQVQAGQVRRFFFGVAESVAWNEGETGDWPVALYESNDGKRKPIEGMLKKVGDPAEDIWTEDYGIIIRTPHPIYSNRMLMVIAGAHSLGTGAACLAATRSSIIQIIREHLPPGTLSDKSSSFWVLVKGVTSRHDHLLDEDGVSIVEVGSFQKV